MSDERLAAEIDEAKEQIKQQPGDYGRLLGQIERLEAAARGKGEVDAELLNSTHALINQAPALLKATDRGAGLAGERAPKAPPTPLAELRQVLVDLKSARS